jgi:hypothetical protein
VSPSESHTGTSVPAPKRSHDANGKSRAHDPGPKPLVDAVSLPKEQAASLTRTALILLAVGVVLAGAGAAVDAHRFAYSYLVGFMFTTTLALGALFFVVLQHLTRAGWSVAARRHMEWMTGILPVSALLFIPVALLAHYPYHHWMSEEAAHDPVIHAKAPYLNVPFFFGRAVLYFAVWSGIAYWFARTSRRQDDGKHADLTLKMQARSAPAMVAFAFTLTFAGFDWLMSLDPHWYSTIFGVYIFSGGVTSSLSALALITLLLQGEGLLQRVSTVEHRHDIGKLLFGFTIFWAYIAFSQYFLIWYANIPEETIFFRIRGEGLWRAVSTVLVLGHFFIPFAVLMSRHSKRTREVLGGIAVLMLLMHYVDMYWLVMPNYDEGRGGISWIDAAGFLLPAAAGFFVVVRQMSQGPLYPVGDPRLLETVKVDNP